MFISIQASYGCHSVEEKGKDGWDYDTANIDSSCTMYIEYAAGRYLMNISTIDSCTSLSSKKYLEGYQKLLNQYHHKMLSDKGIVTFHTPFSLLNDNLIADSLAGITNKKFN